MRNVSSFVSIHKRENLSFLGYCTSSKIESDRRGFALCCSNELFSSRYGVENLSLILLTQKEEKSEDEQEEKEVDKKRKKRKRGGEGLLKHINLAYSIISIHTRSFHTALLFSTWNFLKIYFMYFRGTERDKSFICWSTPKMLAKAGAARS